MGPNSILALDMQWSSSRRPWRCLATASTASQQRQNDSLAGVSAAAQQAHMHGLAGATIRAD